MQKHQIMARSYKTGRCKIKNLSTGKSDWTPNRIPPLFQVGDILIVDSSGIRLEAEEVVEECRALVPIGNKYTSEDRTDEDNAPA